MDAPCKDCKDRSMTCHSECEKYLLFKRERERNKQEYLKKRQGTDYRSAFTEKVIRKRMRNSK